MNLTISHYCESKVLNQKISTKHDMIYSYNAVYQIPRPRDIEIKLESSGEFCLKALHNNNDSIQMNVDCNTDGI